MTSADEWDELFLDWGNDAEGNPLPLSVETYQGPGMKGPKYAAAHSLPGLPQFPQQRLVRNSDNNEVTSTAAIYAPLDERARFTPHSRVTLADGRPSVVIAVAPSDIGELFSFVRVDVE